MSFPNPVIVSGGAGYIGSHVVHALKANGFSPLVIDNLSNGHGWTSRNACVFQQADIADVAAVRGLCRDYKPVAALHFAAFIEVAESSAHPAKYFSNNRDKAKIFFDTLAAEGVGRIVFSSTAAVYGETNGFVTEDFPTRPINPYGQSKLDAESYLRDISSVASCTLRYFNVAGATAEAGLGEAHVPETHLLPRVILPLIDAPAQVRQALGLGDGFKIFGDDHPTPDGTAVRDYVHVMDLADAHIRALRYLLAGGANAIFNLGSGAGFSVREIVQAARDALDRPAFDPPVGPRRAGDPAILVACSDRARAVLGWAPRRSIFDMIQSAAAWHRSDAYVRAILDKIALAA